MRRTTHGTTRQLTREECFHLLGSAPWGRLGVIVGDRPEIFPVNHVVDEDSILIRTGSGTKLTEAVDRVVAFQVDGVAPVSGAAWSVHVAGRATEVNDVGEIMDLLPRLAAPMEAGPKPHILRIRIGEVTGVTFPIQSEQWSEP